MTTAAALQRYLVSRDPIAGSVDPASAGNGSLMRLAPVVLFFYPDVQAALMHARRSSETTHRAPEAVDCCELLADALISALLGESKASVLRHSLAHVDSARVAALANGACRHKPIEQIRGSGYCVESLEAALWCFARSSSFEETVLTAVNLGDDADTTGAVAGQITGAFYGASGIPPRRLECLHMRGEITRLADSLLRRHGTGGDS